MKTKELIGVGLLVFAVVKLTQPRQIVVPPQPQGNVQNNYLAWVQFAKIIVDQALVLYGTIKALWDPGGPFYNTPIPPYDPNTAFWEDVSSGKLAGIGRIGAIYPAIPAVFECNDGTYTTSGSPRGCVRHGGKKNGTPVQLSDKSSNWRWKTTG